MFSSLASFLFGSSTSATTNCELNKNSDSKKEQQLYLTCDNPLNNCSDKDTITEANVPTSLTNGGLHAITSRSKNKRYNRKNKNKRQLPEAAISIIAEPPESSGSQTSQSSDGDFDSDENGWFFVEKEEEKLSLIGDNERISTPASEHLKGSQPEPASLHQKLEKNGPRQYQYGNYQKTNENTNALLVNSCRGTDRAKTSSDEGIAQSLYSATGYKDSGYNISAASYDSSGSGTKLFTMVDSWYLTPPPCFTSNVRIQLVISPFENLLIEHPSMSVYHSITSAQKATESFVNFDLKENRLNQIHVSPLRVKMPKNHQRKHGEKENLQHLESPELVVLPNTPSAAVIDGNTQVVAEKQVPRQRIDRCTAAQLKMELFAMNGQKCMVIRDRQNLRRSAILRSNQVLAIQGRGNRQRRSDLQHCRLISGVNNNRKCCY